jgi:hypothetical protein
MLTRRLAACACALALVIPAAAIASPASDPEVATPAHTVYGDTKYDLQNQSGPIAPVRGTESLDRVGSMTAEQLAAAYGRTKPAAPAHAAPARAAIVSNNGDTNGWRIAAVVEAAVLAAFAIGGVVLIGGRQRRAPRMGM